MTSSSVFATDVGTFSQEESTVATMPSRVSIFSIESVDAVELHKIPTTLKPLETPIVIKSVDVVEIDTTPSVKSATGIVVPEVSVELKTVDVRDTLITMDTAGLEQLADQWYTLKWGIKITSYHLMQWLDYFVQQGVVDWKNNDLRPSQIHTLFLKTDEKTVDQPKEKPLLIDTGAIAVKTDEKTVDQPEEKSLLTNTGATNEKVVVIFANQLDDTFTDMPNYDLTASNEKLASYSPTAQDFVKQLLTQ